MIASIFSRVAHLIYFSPELEGWAVSSYFLLSDHKEHKSDNSSILTSFATADALSIPLSFWATQEPISHACLNISLNG